VASTAQVAAFVPQSDSTLIAANQGRLMAARYFYHYELPRIDAWLNVVALRDMTCAEIPEEAF
jgi:butyryl-CoA dehydrogenase